MFYILFHILFITYLCPSPWTTAMPFTECMGPPSLVDTAPQHYAPPYRTLCTEGAQAPTEASHMRLRIDHAPFLLEHKRRQWSIL